MILLYDEQALFTPVGGGSDGTTASAWVMKEAAVACKKQLLELAAKKFNAPDSFILLIFYYSIGIIDVIDNHDNTPDTAANNHHDCRGVDFFPYKHPEDKNDYEQWAECFRKPLSVIHFFTLCTVQ